MPKWILLTVLAAAFACERDRDPEQGTEQGTDGAVGAERDGLREEGRQLEQEGRELKQDAEREWEEHRPGGEAQPEGQQPQGQQQEGQPQGQQQEGQQQQQGQQSEGQQPQGQAPTAQDQGGDRDQEVVQQVRQALMGADLSVAAQNTQIMAEDGKVTLRGNVASAQERLEVERLTRSAPGVTEVDNQLEVGVR